MEGFFVKKNLNVKCPKCQKEFDYYSSEFRPFCCEQCRMVDLGHWLSESYKVPSKVPLSEEDFLELEQTISGQENEEEGTNDEQEESNEN
jgi:endogenous inhibitor of DNA gyrase (YacG/DUF329 family)